MNAVICVEAIIYVPLYNLHGCTFKLTHVQSIMLGVVFLRIQFLGVLILKYEVLSSSKVRKVDKWR